MTVIPSEEEPPHFLREVLAEPDLAARVLQTGEWTKVDDDNVDDFVRELDDEGPNDIERFIIYEEHRLAATRDGAELLRDRSDTEREETQFFGEQGVEIFRVDPDAFDLIQLMPDVDFEPEPARFDQRSSAGAMDKVALLHGFLVQGHSFFFNDKVEFDTGSPPNLQPTPKPAKPQNGEEARKIGIIDTGADNTHSWLDGIDADPEDNGSIHGTIVTGIARQGDPYASIVVRRPDFLATYILRELSIATALYELVESEECDVVNCSFGASTFGKVPLLRWVISWLRERNEFDVVGAAGNHHKGHTRSPIYPAAWKEVIAVAAGDGTAPDPLYEWSNGETSTGPAWVDHIVKIDERTSGHWLRSSAPRVVPDKDRFAYVIGTSAVAPLVAALPDPRVLTTNAHNTKPVARV